MSRTEPLPVHILAVINQDTFTGSWVEHEEAGNFRVPEFAAEDMCSRLTDFSIDISGNSVVFVLVEATESGRCRNTILLEMAGRRRSLELPMLDTQLLCKECLCLAKVQKLLHRPTIVL
ncbi:hypothetical protein PFLmoz3_04118 [Pseudomonas fluorescens]|uniref:Uncharacterized protein n=1 Tax=Pseudomonas fluorescens TaxID=294 RepID=A0A109LET7_PSEFL|nr:hypothetical protein PFLmoz3_04118 [Pseudomonas fluorescens]